MRNCLGVLLVKLDISSAELARRINVNRTLINKIVSGKKNPSLKTAFAIAYVLGCKVDDIFFPTETEMGLRNGNTNNQRDRKSA